MDAAAPDCLLIVYRCTRNDPGGGLFTSGAMTAYCTYLCASALKSEPEGRCTPGLRSNGEGLEITGFVVAIAVLAISTVGRSSLTLLNPS